ncbi:hypothetical protein JQ293_05385 [Helicobacter pylori]|uniref:hypothetical protein n=1 Tax=Helicobacter pylori TaxID=210 RepID=UPI00193229D0|nr:hypothetical protein [Helicobacter pylori]MBM0620834.1 hypothetical protein [Helicobacter pylori]
MEALTLFLWGENLEHVNMLGFVVVVGGYLKKYLGVLSLLSYRVKISFKLALSMSD